MSKQSISGRRRRLFYLVAFSVPVVLLAMVELVLRLFGFGYATQFFLKTSIAGQSAYVQNDQFTRRFFPPVLVRFPEPTVVTAAKPANTCRIVIFGESAAMGDPAPAFGFGRVLEVVLSARYPERHFEVINVAITAINSHVIREIARDCAPRGGDVWVVYMGHNEVVGPYGAGTVFSARTPGLGVIRTSLALKTTRLGQGIDALFDPWMKSPNQPAAWQGMEMFLKQQVPQDDPRLAKVYDHFRKNLSDILEIGTSAGARIVLSTVISNLKDCAPFASLHRADLTPTQLAEWEKLYAAGITNESASSCSDAYARYADAARIDDRFADLQFRLGRCAQRLGNHHQALNHFIRARDLDTLRFRADSQINSIIRQTASRHDTNQVRLLDAVQLFSRISPIGIVGEEFLFEHVHFNFEGNHRIASALAAEIEQLLPETLAQQKQMPFLADEECARRLVLTDWDRYQILDEVYRRLVRPPFTHRLDQEKRMIEWKEFVKTSRRALEPDSVAAAAEEYRRAISERPDDWVLRENFAKLLQASGVFAEAEQQWRAVIERLPHYAPAYYDLGNILDAQGKSAEALPFFRKALRCRPGALEAYAGLGLALANQGKGSEAKAHYQTALQRRPDFSEVRVNLGHLLAKEGKIEEAITQYTVVLRADSNNIPAHLNLGKLLVSIGKTDEAMPHYRAALELQPAHAIAHFNLANALASQGRPEALAHFAEAVRLQPALAEARYNFGLELTKMGRDGEALAQFAEAVRLNPTFADGHLNYGVALAKERRTKEAIAEFEETLRLAPQNTLAKKYLDQARAWQGR